MLYTILLVDQSSGRYKKILMTYALKIYVVYYKLGFVFARILLSKVKAVMALIFPESVKVSKKDQRYSLPFQTFGQFVFHMIQLMFT